MKKLLTLLGSVGMVAATAATVVACNPGKNDAKVSDSTIKVGKHGEINLTRDEIKEVEGYNDVKAYEEGFVPAPATKADAEKPKPVLDKVKLENGVISFTGLKEGKATIVLQGTKKAPVTPGTKTDAAAPKLELLKTKFTVIVEPSRQPVKSIKEVIKTLALGEIADVKPETILATINKVNAGANLLATDIKIEVGTDNKSAKIIGQGIFNGDVTVTFTVKTPTEDKRTDIGTLVKTLGKLEVDTTKDAVIDAFIAKNPNAKLVKDELQIKDELAADATTAKIEVKSTSTTHKGFVDVNFEKKPVEGSKTDIGTLVKVLGKLEVDTTKDAVIEAFIAKNP
ncbi:lipoprotein, partial [Williamsoniiplasma luminosum]